MKVYVTGATGFVGKSLIGLLGSNGHEAFPVVRKNAGFKNEILFDLSTATENEMFEVFKNADCIVHLAAHANFSSTFNSETYNTNCLANLKLINAISRIDVHFVFASNALIAGLSTEQIKVDSADNPDIPYNISKYISENYLESKLKNYSIIRIGGIYGYDGPKHLFLNRLINEAIEGNLDFKITNNGRGERNYIYVKDLCNWIIEIINSRSTGKFLIAGPDTSSISSILKTLNNIFSKGKATISVNDQQRGNHQIIHSSPTPIKLHTYQEAFLDIKSNNRAK
jgi:nucleoside-diphosphate-sugar epimerase